MKQWLKYFQHNRDNRLPIPWEQRLNPGPKLRKALIASLQRFQIGESGEGLTLQRHVAATGDADYIETIKLFIKEENEHARLMAEILKRLDAPLLESHWSDNAFIALRHVFGLEEELLVLLIPEMIAQRYFRALRDGTKEPIIRAVCEQIMHDEDGHVAFHVSYLQDALAKLPLWRRALLRIGWRVLFRGACAVVMYDHYSVLRAVDVSPAKFWWDAGLIFDQNAAAIFSWAPTHQFFPVAANPAPVALTHAG
jgi:hypothetical protein